MLFFFGERVTNPLPEEGILPFPSSQDSDQYRNVDWRRVRLAFSFLLARMINFAFSGHEVPGRSSPSLFSRVNPFPFFFGLNARQGGVLPDLISKQIDYMGSLAPPSTVNSPFPPYYAEQMMPFDLFPHSARRSATSLFRQCRRSPFFLDGRHIFPSWLDEAGTPIATALAPLPLGAVIVIFPSPSQLFSNRGDTDRAAFFQGLSPSLPFVRTGIGAPPLRKLSEASSLLSFFPPTAGERDVAPSFFPHRNRFSHAPPFLATFRKRNKADAYGPLSSTGAIKGFFFFFLPRPTSDFNRLRGPSFPFGILCGKPVALFSFFRETNQTFPSTLKGRAGFSLHRL